MSSLTFSSRPTTGMWRWLWATEAGVAVDGPAITFSSETAAQHWLDRNADSLLERRIAWVSLLDGEHVVDGPLSLR